MSQVAPIPRYKVIVASLNVRSGPGTKYAVIRKLPYGSLIYILDATLGELVNGDARWLLVSADWGGPPIGYVLSAFVEYAPVYV